MKISRIFLFVLAALLSGSLAANTTGSSSTTPSPDKSIASDSNSDSQDLVVAGDKETVVDSKLPATKTDNPSNEATPAETGHKSMAVADTETNDVSAESDDESDEDEELDEDDC